MYKMRESNPEEALTATAALAMLDKISDLVDLGLLKTENGRFRYLYAMDAKVDLLLEIENPELAHETALEAVEFSCNFENEKVDHLKWSGLRLKALKDLVKSKIAMGDASGVVETTKQIRDLLSEDGDISGTQPEANRNRERTLLWALEKEIDQLAKLGRFEEAIDQIHQRWKIVFISPPFAGQRRYYSGALQMAQTLALWTESENFSSDDYEVAKTEAIEWLELAFKNKHTTNGDLLDDEVWNPFRESEKFLEIQNRYGNTSGRKND